MTMPRVLFVDDCADDVELAVAALRREQLELEHALASNVTEAIAMFEAERWDVVVSDYRLGPQSGLDFLRMIRERDPHVPFILLSGTIGEERAVETIRSGANDYVMKDRLGPLGAVIRRELAAAEARAAKQRLEEQLRSAEERYRSTVEQAPIAIANAGRDNRFFSVNQRFCEMLGYREEEMLGRPFTDFIHPDDVAACAEWSRQLLAGEIHEVRRHIRRYIRKDGTVAWATANLAVVRNRAGEVEYMIGCIEDLSQQKAAQEKALVQGQLIQSVEQAVIATDIEGVITQWNAFAEKLYGWTAEQAVGRSILDIVYEEARHEAAAIATATMNGASWSGEMKMKRRDGGILPVYATVAPIVGADGTVIGAVGVSHDLTERKRAEDELREHKLQLIDAQEIARIASWTYDYRTGERSWSESARGVLGVEPGVALVMGEIIGRIHPEDRDHVRELQRRAHELLEPCVSEFRLATSRGERTLSIRCRIESDAAGTPLRIIGVVQDITEVKQIEEELRRRTAQQTAVANLGQVALSGAPLQSIFDQATFLLPTLLEADVSEIVRKHGDDFVLVAGEGWSVSDFGMVKCGAGSQAAFTVETGNPVVVTDAAAETRFRPCHLVRNEGIVSGVTVVINSADGVPWGVLGVHSRTPRIFAPYEVEFLRSMASVLSQAIDRAAADATLRTRARQQSAIASLGQLVLNSVDPEVLEQAAELLVTSDCGDFGFICMLTEQGMLRRVAGRCWSDDLPVEIPVSAQSQSGYTALTREPVIVGDYRTDPRFRTQQLTVPYGIHSGLMVPIASARQTFGVLAAQSRRVHAFGSDDVTFLQSLANVLAEALEREQAREAIEESEQRYRRIFDGATEIIFTIDRDGRFLALNPSFAAITGWSCEEWLVRPFDELIVPEDRERILRLFGELVATGKNQMAVTRLLGRTREVIVDVQSFAKIENGTIIEIYGFARDITEARRVAEEREQVVRSLHLLLESTVEGIYTIDLDGQCTMVNRAAAAFLGLAPEELIGRRVHDLLHARRPDGSPLDLDECPITSVLRTGESKSVSSDAFCRKDGTLFPVAYSAAPIIDDGRLVGAVVTFTDLTERRKLESKLEQANRLSSLGRLAATVAHEFNNVLMGIAPFIEVIRRAETPQKVTAALDHISGSVKRGRRVTQDILRFTQPGVPVQAPVDVNSWLRDVVTEASSMLGPAYTITADTSPLTIDADAGQLHQIFMNLILNARDAMPRGGSIRIEARCERDDARFAFGVVENPGRYAHLLVSDHGYGMDEETLRCAFEPLFTTKKNGTGLGLPITHQVVRGHGGEIFIESTRHVGTTFHIFLPLAVEERAAEPIEVAEVRPGPARGRLLLVEDDTDVAAGLTALLESEGFEVTVVGNGKRALELVRTEAPDAVILDIRLPDCDGRTVYTGIAAIHPKLPVVFSTGHAERSRLESLLTRPNVGYLFKPYDGDALMAELNRAMGACA